MTSRSRGMRLDRTTQAWPAQDAGRAQCLATRLNAGSRCALIRVPMGRQGGRISSRDCRRFPPPRAGARRCRGRRPHGRYRLPCGRTHLRDVGLRGARLRQPDAHARHAGRFRRRVAAPLPAGVRWLGPHGHHAHPPARGRPRDPGRCAARRVGAACREEPAQCEAPGWPADRDRRAAAEDGSWLAVMSPETVRRTVLTSAAVLALAGPLVSQTASDDGSFAVSQGRVPGPVLGLLRLPEAVGDGCGSGALRVFALQAIPTATAPPLGTLRYQVSGRATGGASCDSARFVMEKTGGGEEAVPNDESDYEVSALVVLGRRGPWFQVALQGGRAWMRHDAEADFLSYPELLTDRLSYVRAGWDGRLWASPGAKAPQPAIAAWRKVASDDVAIEMLG